MTQCRRSNAWRMWGNALPSFPIISTTFQTFTWPDRNLISFLPYILAFILSWNSRLLIIIIYLHSTRPWSSSNRAWPTPQAKIEQGEGRAPNGQRLQAPQLEEHAYLSKMSTAAVPAISVTFPMI